MGAMSYLDIPVKWSDGWFGRGGGHRRSGGRGGGGRGTGWGRGGGRSRGGRGGRSRTHEVLRPQTVHVRVAAAPGAGRELVDLDLHVLPAVQVVGRGGKALG